MLIDITNMFYISQAKEETTDSKHKHPVTSWEQILIGKHIWERLES